jgi:hypothetical protein
MITPKSGERKEELMVGSNNFSLDLRRDLLEGVGSLYLGGILGTPKENILPHKQGGI